MLHSSRFAAAATAFVLLASLALLELLPAFAPHAGSACGRGGDDCCCRRPTAPMHRAERQKPCMSRSCSLAKPSAPAMTLSPEREVAGRAVAALAGSPRGALPMIGLVAPLALASPSGPPRLPPLPPPRLLAA